MEKLNYEMWPKLQYPHMGHKICIGFLDQTWGERIRVGVLDQTCNTHIWVGKYALVIMFS